MSILESAAQESTCLKRVTICMLTDSDGCVLACESNRCAPPGGACGRLGVSNTKGDYPVQACGWEHAEQRAVRALPPGARPTKATLFGHDFYCNECEAALRAAGVVELLVSNAPFGGLR